MSDKDARAILEPLAEVLSSLELTDLPGMGRAARAADLLHCVPQTGLPVSCSASPEKALLAALDRVGPDDRILVFGSFFIVGPVLQLLNQSGHLPGARAWVGDSLGSEGLGSNGESL